MTLALLASSFLFPAMAAAQSSEQAAETAAPNEGGAPAGEGAQEIVVTALKKGTERLQDVPGSVTAISADSLVESNQLRIEDYYTKIPNFSVSPSPDIGNSQIVQIRGITTGLGSTPTVGILLDDVPLGITGNTIPDLDPSDLAQIEVLRGPQGVLFGSATMGGLVRYVTKDPSTERVSGRVQAGISGVDNGNSIGYSLRGAVNLPLSETLAVRASGFFRNEPGYIDNPVVGIDGINEQDSYGGRVAILWQPSSSFSAKASALVQKVKTDGSGQSTLVPGFGNREQNFVIGTGIFDQTIQAYSLTLKGQIGSFDLTSLTGYNVMEFTNSFDATFAYGPFATLFFGPDYTASKVFPHSNAKGFTQEVRASTPIGSMLTWQVGGFYRADKLDTDIDYAAVNATTGAIAGNLLKIVSRTHSYEKALFTDLIVHLTDRFDVELGARQSWLRGVNDFSTLSGAFYPTPVPSPRSENKSKAFTYLLAPRYKFSRDLMVYARLASGFRPGGGVSNPTPADTCIVADVPCSYGPDKTKNYEVGMKGSVLDNRLSFDLSLYHIDWTGIQFLQSNPVNFFTYIDNGGKAKSEGVELSLVARPVRGWTVSAWGAYNNAVLTQDFPATSTAYGLKGDRLPNSSKYSANLSIEHHFSLSESTTGFVGGSLSYVGDSYGIFLPTPGRTRFDDYVKLDLNAGINHGSWAFNIYVNNLTDKRVAIGGGLGTYPPYAFRFIQPRNFGFSIAKTF
ncbi:TonB-dependent receptor [Sphingosinicella rhizophila]|uniref:TonB-dependent receptor n=1 Tax=Sphingosinicella rhizophila TaxID=3050082 RepID=A0ABU3Q9X5_9SPHN|nr:TonB-dependent receptor plug domain-containing protein [Sphingosinicella sp. GR2756]MDT9600213.1 TonB-dependent receptor [Sphingosinicella sp. GR2756]